MIVYRVVPRWTYVSISEFWILQLQPWWITRRQQSSACFPVCQHKIWRRWRPFSRCPKGALIWKTTVFREKSGSCTTFVAHLQDAVRNDCMDYRSFLQSLQAHLKKKPLKSDSHFLGFFFRMIFCWSLKLYTMIHKTDGWNMWEYDWYGPKYPTWKCKRSMMLEGKNMVIMIDAEVVDTRP